MVDRMKQGTHFVRNPEPPVNSGTLWVLYCHHCHKKVVTEDDAFCPECDRFVAPGLEWERGIKAQKGSRR